MFKLPCELGWQCGGQCGQFWDTGRFLKGHQEFPMHEERKDIANQNVQLLQVKDLEYTAFL
jgi:hypothetical protein